MYNKNNWRIPNPKIWQVVRHAGTGFEDNENYPCDVIINSGNYSVDGRVSNFWYWRRILPDGSLSDIEHGYGDFIAPEKEYEVEVTVKIT